MWLISKVSTDFEPKLDDIRTEYHPHSTLPPRIDRFEEYGREDDHPRPTSADCHPLDGFGTRAEFDFAELALEAALNHPQIDRLLEIIDNIRNGAPFTFHKYKDVETAWEIASQSHAGVRSHCLSNVLNNTHFFPSVREGGHH